MEEQQNKVERLDIAAKAIIARNALRYEQLSLLFAVVLFALLGIYSTASRIETLAVRALAGTCLVLLVLFLFEWRYSYHVFLLASVGGGIVGYWVHSQLYPHSNWIGHSIVACYFLVFGIRAWPLAVPFATAHKKGWEEECRMADKLYEMLMGGSGASEDLLVSAGNFWTGYFSYRLLHCEEYWAVAKFKREKYDKMLEFRVLEKEAVRVAEPAAEALELYIAGKKIRNAKLGPRDYERLSRFAVRSSST